MLAFESLTIAYFSLLAAAALLSRAAPRRIGRVATLAGGIAAAVVVVSLAVPLAVRVWLPHVYLVAGYWLPALLVPPDATSTFEGWLARTDAYWRRPLSVPRWLVTLLEGCYLACYPAVPVAFATMWLMGGLSDADRFWSAVLAAGFACYAGLPWLVSRPPWVLTTTPAVAPDRGRHPIMSLNQSVLRRVSHQFVTFPSGHVAVSSASALSLLSVFPIGGGLMGMLAAGIAFGAVAGGYHYRLDVIAGALVGAGAWLLVLIMAG